MARDRSEDFAPLSIPSDKDSLRLVFSTLQTWGPRLRTLKELVDGLLNDVSTLEETVITSGQIQFPAVQNASTGANVLDDYEEGTWVPTDASGAGLTFTYPTSSQYIKLGSLVYVVGTVTYPTTINGANAVIGGLPFTILANSVPGLFITYTTEATLRSLALATTTGTLYTFGGVNLTNINMSTDRVDFCGCYRADN